MAGIDIRIQAGSTKESSSIKASGTLLHVITDKEVDTFGLNEEKLKSAVEKYDGRSPDHAYLHSPSSGTDLHKKYGWQQVETVLTIVSADITEITSTPSIIAKKEMANDDDVKNTYTAKITETVQNTTESNWSRTDTIQVSHSIKYSVSFLGTGVEGTTSMSYSHAWGQGGRESKATTVGSELGVSTEILPGQKKVAHLTSSIGTMKVRIVYQASLNGSVAVDYERKHKGHHFWCHDISAVMAAADINNSLEFTEDIEIGYYSNSSITIAKDSDKPTKDGDEDKDKDKDKRKTQKNSKAEGHGVRSNFHSFLLHPLLKK